MIELSKLIQTILGHILIKVRYLIISGFAFSSLGKHNEAIKMYDCALKINSNNSKTYVHKGGIFRFIFRSCTHKFRKFLLSNRNV